MEPLPCEFLKKVAQEHILSPEQTEALIQRLGHKGNLQDHAGALHITPTTLGTRMTGVYRTFGISGRGPGKFHRLYHLLLSKYQKTQPTDIQQPQNEASIVDLVQEIRSKVKADITARCGMMRVLDEVDPRSWTNL